MKNGSSSHTTFTNFVSKERMKVPERSDFHGMKSTGQRTTTERPQVLIRREVQLNDKNVPNLSLATPWALVLILTRSPSWKTDVNWAKYATACKWNKRWKWLCSNHVTVKNVWSSLPSTSADLAVRRYEFQVSILKEKAESVKRLQKSYSTISKALAIHRRWTTN